jgi:hypothetical protein
MNILIDYYKNRLSTKKSGSRKLFGVLKEIETNKVLKKKINRKGNTFSSFTDLGRKHKNIIGFTGLLFLDIDNCSDHVQVKQFFINLEHTVAVWYSSSGRNVHALIKIPICTTLKEFKLRHKAFSCAVEPYLKDVALLDSITSNPTQLAFESYDSEIFINNDIVEFESITIAPKLVNITRPTVLRTDKQEQWCIDWLQNKFNNINTNGYPKVLKTSYALGGYCSGGYINKSNALEIMTNCINNNPYLNSTESSGSIKTYLKAGRAAFDKGLQKPLHW